MDVVDPIPPACRIFIETLVDLVLDQERNDLAAAAFRRHRRHCARCRDELAAFRRIAAELRGTGAVNPPGRCGVSADERHRPTVPVPVIRRK